MQQMNLSRSGKFGPITMVELTWNVNQPGRWRRPALLGQLKEEDTDWKRFLMNRPNESLMQENIWSFVCSGLIHQACRDNG